MKIGEDLLERDLQAKCVAWWNDAGLPGILFHVPNEGKRTRLEAAALRALGVVAGAPDFVLLLEGGLCACIELKTMSGMVSPEQERFEERCVALEHPYRVVRSLEEFKKAVCAEAELARFYLGQGSLLEIEKALRVP